ncbi:MAG: DUF6434 domain-containing protein [Pseudomonadota bacterium]
MRTRAEFDRWYWPLELLQEFCSRLGVSRSGRKHELRERVALALDGKTTNKPALKKPGKARWNKKALTLNTVITEDVSFGPHVRGFFKEQIGSRFVCHSDFMAWVRGNTGATLGDAVDAWRVLEARKNDPGFRREIADGNNFLQYLRDLRDANPQLSLDAAKRCWDAKKIRPATHGKVIYEAADLRFLDRA